MTGCLSHLLKGASLPMWERGLKLLFNHAVYEKGKSLPMWERGLKRIKRQFPGDQREVAPYVGAWIETAKELLRVLKATGSLPMWERGLKPQYHRRMVLGFKSLPMWERGLKRDYHSGCRPHRQVAPYVGAWIETGKTIGKINSIAVAPYVGAWIETGQARRYADPGASLPMWERGLKHYFRAKSCGIFGRSLCGSVD